MLKKKPFAWLALLLAFGLVAAACGDDDDSTDATSAGGTDRRRRGLPRRRRGRRRDVSGSSTVEPISTAVGEKLLDCSGIAATVDGPGTGDGFELFCAGETDISDASRPINEEEVGGVRGGRHRVHRAEGRLRRHLRAHQPGQRRVECLNFADLYALFGPESEGFDNWSDAQALATELGSRHGAPRR